MVDQLAHRQRHEVHEHDLDDGPLSSDCGAYGDSHNRVFADGSIDDALVAKLVRESLGDAEGPSDRHVLTEDYDAGVAPHLLSDTFAKRIHEPLRRHRHYPNTRAVMASIERYSPCMA